MAGTRRPRTLTAAEADNNDALERRLQAKDRELDALRREFDSFSHSVSHDLRSPMRAIVGYSTLILRHHKDALPPEAAASFERIQAAAHRMGRLLEDLLDLSRIGRSSVRRQTLDLTAMSRDIVARLTQTEPDRHVDFDVEPGLKVNADADLVRLALENLLGNAWKFTRDATPQRIRFGRRRLPQEDAYFVADTGSGFDPAHAAPAPQPPERQPGALGAGMGMAVVDRVVRLHHGRMWAERPPGEGTTLYFTLRAPEETR